MPVVMTKRDEELLETLTLKVHLFTLLQAATAWWGTGPQAIRNARERLGKLSTAGLVERSQVNLFPMLSLNTPEVSWTPGGSMPQFGPIAYRFQKRWDAAMRLETVYIATRKAANQFGGFGGKFKHRTQLTHDVHVTEIYLRLNERDIGPGIIVTTDEAV
ncbi:MAG: hypothetical protein H8E66_33255 [Planctomycetes bacterium]|nr:hypothetical protein [Planctomycetota bacterium]